MDCLSFEKIQHKIMMLYLSGEMIHQKIMMLYLPCEVIQQKMMLYLSSAIIVFVWSRNGANRTKTFVKGLLAPEIKIVGGATC